MVFENNSLTLPSYDYFVDSIQVLSLPISASELHGMMCGYLCAGAALEGELYIRALMGNNKSDEARAAALAMFQVFSISQQQIDHFDFEFQMMLPREDEPLGERASAFSEWCDGFTQSLTLAGVTYDDLQEEESQDALQHLTEFAELDCDSLDVAEDDEKALMEVYEYARLAVLRLHGDLTAQEQTQGGNATAH